MFRIKRRANSKDQKSSKETWQDIWQVCDRNAANEEFKTYDLLEFEEFKPVINELTNTDNYSWVQHGVGNIGSSTTYFNTVFAKATSAQYADLAENYLADTEYTPGTVVIFGGLREITVTTEAADERVAGVISTNPAYLMNSGEPGLPVALRGKVPVRVVGPVTKGDSLVTSTTPGVAISVGRERVYGQAVFAKSLESNDSDGEKVILAVIV
jgi:hypothetical protein